jgi:hypothetical protein
MCWNDVDVAASSRAGKQEEGVILAEIMQIESEVVNSNSCIWILPHS